MKTRYVVSLCVRTTSVSLIFAKLATAGRSGPNSPPYQTGTRIGGDTGSGFDRATAASVRARSIKRSRSMTKGSK